MDNIGNVLDTKTKTIGKRCADFRKEVLHLTSTELCRCTGQNIKNISAFEHGHSSNLRYIFCYYNMCITQSEQEQFADYIFKGVY